MQNWEVRLCEHFIIYWNIISTAKVAKVADNLTNNSDFDYTYIESVCFLINNTSIYLDRK